MDKIITSGQILVFEVSKRPSWHEYYHGAKLNRFGLAGFSIVSIFDFQMFIYRPFEELQGWNLKFKLITPKSITGTYFDTKLSRFCLAGLSMAAILDIQMYMSQLFEEVQSWNLELKLIIPISITDYHIWTMAAILNIQMSIFQLFEEVQSWKLELKFFTPQFITCCHFGTIVAILDFLNNRQILEFKESKQSS